MATRSTKKNIDTKPQEKNDYIELKLPRFSKDFQPKSYTPLLVLFLIIGAYFLGVLTTRLSYLETESKNTQGVVDPNAPTPTPSYVDVKQGNLPALGNKDAKVTIVEFSDFQCPFCKSFNDSAFVELKKNYIDTGKVKYSFRHYPLPIHPNAPLAAEASECANEQSNFWEYHDELFKTQDLWSNLTNTEAQQQFQTYAANLGLNTAQFDSCLTTGKFKSKVDADATAAGVAGVQATPTAFINGIPVVGALPYDSFKTIIDEQLKK